MSPLLLLVVAQAATDLPESGPEAEPLTDLAQPALTVPTPDSAAGVATVTLEQLLESADAQNVDRRITIQQHRRARAEERQAWTALLPGLSVQAGWTHNEVTATIPAGAFGTNPMTMELVPASDVTLISPDQLDLAARIDVALIDTGRWMRASAASAAEESAEARARLGSDQVKRAVVGAWYGYAGALALKDSAERAIAAAEAQLKLQEIRFRSGSVPELDVFRARAEVERNRQVVADTERLIAISRRNLRSLSGLDPGQGATLPDADVRPLRAIDEYEAGVAELPAVQAAMRDLSASDKAALAAKLALVPIVGAQFTERVTNAAGFGGQAASYNFGLNLTWRLDVPVFYAMEAQSAANAIAGLAVEKVVLQSRDQINFDYQTLRATITKVGAVKAQVESAQKARNVAATRYQVGASTQLEVIQADRDLFAAEAQQIQAQSDLASARVALQISAGLAIEAL